MVHMLFLQTETIDRKSDTYLILIFFKISRFKRSVNKSSVNSNSFYVFYSGPIKRFLKILPLMSPKVKCWIKVKSMSSTIKNRLTPSIWNMSGIYSRMQAEIKKHCKHADYCPCAAHSLNSVVELASSFCIEFAIFFYHWTSYFFFGSYLSLEIHDRYLLPISPIVWQKKLSGTRSAWHVNINVLFDCYSHIKTTLFQVAENLEQKNETIATTKGVLNKINNLGITVLLCLENNLRTFQEKNKLNCRD